MKTEIFKQKKIWGLLLVFICTVVYSLAANWDKEQQEKINEKQNYNSLNKLETNAFLSFTDGKIIAEKVEMSPNLTSKKIKQIFQDKTGLVWLVVENAIASYDGYEFKIYKDNLQKGLTWQIKTFFFDQEKYLWLATDEALYCFDLQNKYFVKKITKRELLIEEDDEIIALTKDEKQGIWLSLRKSGIAYFRVEQNLSLYKESNKIVLENQEKKVKQVYIDKASKIWLVFEKGKLISYDVTQEKNEEFQLPVTDEITTVLMVKDDLLLIGTQESGLFSLDEKTKKMQNYLNENNGDDFCSNNILFLYKDSEEKVWVCADDGLYLFNERKGYTPLPEKIVHEIGAKDTIISMYDDGLGVVWLGTEDGLVKIYGSNFYNLSQLDGLSDNNVLAVYLDTDGIIWLGTYKGLNRVDLLNKKVDTFYTEEGNSESLSSNTITAILQGKENKLWIGTKAGLDLFDKVSGCVVQHFLMLPTKKNNDGTQILEQCEVSALIRDKEGFVWAGSFGSGLYKYKDEELNGLAEILGHYVKEEGNKTSISSDRITSILESKDGYLWLGTADQGLNQFDKKNNLVLKKFQHDSSKKNTLGDNNINCLIEDHEQKIWIGTMEDGLNILDRQQDVFKKIRSLEETGENTIWGITEDKEGTIWASGNNTLVRVNTNNLAIRTYNQKDGLQNKHFFAEAVCQENEVLFFGGEKGLTYFNYHQLGKKDAFKGIIVTDIKVDGRTVLDKVRIDDGYKVDLSYKDNLLAISFAAIDYTSKGQMLYAYKMEGLDRDWIDCGTRRYAVFNNLSSGSYRFCVRSADAEGMWRENELKIDIVVYPPWWKTWWAYISYFLLLALAVYFYVYMRLKNSKEKIKEIENWNVLLEEKVTERTKAVKNLLDNAEQGFLTFGKDLFVDKEYSKECEKLLGEKIVGKKISDLLYSDNDEQKSFLEMLLPKILEKKSIQERLVYLSLLPNESKLGGKHLQVNYKLIFVGKEQVEKYMTVITDVTEQKMLQEKITKEKQKNLMYGFVTAYYEEFLEMWASFQELKQEVTNKQKKLEKADVLRRIHTLKGECAQLEMSITAENLHNIEECLVKDEMPENLNNLLERAFEQDLKELKNFLGDKLVLEQSVLKVKKESLQKLENWIASFKQDVPKGNLLQKIKALKKKELQDLLLYYSNYCMRLAEREGKSVQFEIQGDIVLVDTDVYVSWIKSLLHIFKNAVYHGIEKIEERMSLGKPVKAKIICIISKEKEGGFSLTVEDDGCGIEAGLLKEKAIASGFLNKEKAALLNQEEMLALIFEAGFSTNEDLNLVSGRGYGLSAVKCITEQLGGILTVNSVLGKGTSFKMTFK